MTDTRGFDQYFTNRAALTGVQPTAGDEILVLRGGTVFRGSLTYNKAIAVLNNNTDETVINTIDVYEEITGAWVQSFATPAFTFTLGQFTYIGTDQIEPAMLFATLSITKLTATQVPVEAAVFVNGAIVGTAMQLSVDDAGVVNVGVAGIHALVTGDVIDVRIRNRFNTESITVADAQLVINQ